MVSISFFWLAFFLSFFVWGFWFRVLNVQIFYSDLPAQSSLKDVSSFCLFAFAIWQLGCFQVVSTDWMKIPRMSKRGRSSSLVVDDRDAVG
ncbi:hypothetical protein LINPERHAP1_LOCUS15642 [Linum perenne]